MIDSTLKVYALLIATGALGAVGDATLHKWARTNSLPWLLASYGLWMGVATLFGFVLRMERTSFGTAVALALLVHSIVAILIDRFYFLGRLTKWEWTGVVLAVAAIVFIEIGRATVHPRG